MTRRTDAGRNGDATRTPGAPDAANAADTTTVASTRGQTPRLPPAGAIPTGVRVVVRMRDGVDPRTGRMTFRDVIGHVLGWDGRVLAIRRDPSRDGSRPAEAMRIDGETIAVLKPVPERRPFIPGRHRSRD